jgi:hypothetical protein
MSRPTVSRPVYLGVKPHLGPKTRFLYCQPVAGLLMWGALSNERTGLSFTIAIGPRQRRCSRVRVQRDSWPYFTVSGSTLLQPGGPGPRIYIPQAQVGRVILPGTGFSFRHFLRLEGLRWKYSNPPARGQLTRNSKLTLTYPRHRPHRKHRVQLFFNYCVCT